MANCIEFRRGSENVVFRKERFNVQAFLDEMKKHADHQHPFFGKDENGNHTQCNVCWFLRDNYELTSNGDIRVYFGQGNSTHTTRDFQWLCSYLNKYVTDPFKVIFYTADEFDDFKQTFRKVIEFTPLEEKFAV